VEPQPGRIPDIARPAVVELGEVGAIHPANDAEEEEWDELGEAIIGAVGDLEEYEFAGTERVEEFERAGGDHRAPECAPHNLSWR